MKSSQNRRLNVFLFDLVKIVLKISKIIVFVLFQGIILSPPDRKDNNIIYVVREFCLRGSLLDVLIADKPKLDNTFIASFVDDLTKVIFFINFLLKQIYRRLFICTNPN